METLVLREMDPLINVGKESLGWWAAEKLRLGWTSSTETEIA